VYRSEADLAQVRVKCKKCSCVFTPSFQKKTMPPPPAPPGRDAGNPFDRLEEKVGDLSRAVYEARQKSPNAIPDTVSHRVSALADSLVDVKREVNSLRRAGQDLETLLEVSNVLNQEHELAPLLNRIMDYAIRTLNAERGFLMMKNPATGALDVSVARGMGEDLAEGESREFSTGVASRVAAEGTPFFTANSQGDDRVSAFASLMRSDARAILCVPLIYKDRSLGTIYIDNKAGAPGFTKDLLPLALSFAGAAAGAIENARLYESVRDETAKRANLSRYLSPTIVDDILSQGDDLVLGGSTVECSILFTDVVGFTSFSERLQPDDLIRLMNDYFTLMADVIFENKGTLDKFIGDATMAIFGAPVFDPDHAARAAKAGLDMLAACRDLMVKWDAEGKPTFGMRVGVNSGAVIAGNLGSLQRMDYTVIGDAVNLASRMESAAEKNSIFVSEYTWEMIKDFARGDDKGPIQVKGKSDKIRVYHVHSIQPPRRDVHHVKRAGPRIEVELFAIYSQEDVSGTRQGIVRDLSARGMLLHSAFVAEAGNSLRISFSLPSGRQVKGISAQVVRATWMEETDGQKGYKFNLMFENVSDENKSALSSYLSVMVG
jgi:adenylate cyclase